MSELSLLQRQIHDHMEHLHPKQRKTQRMQLTLTTAALLESPNANGMELAASMDIDSDRQLTRYQRLVRGLKNELIDPDEVMRPYVGEVLRHLTRDGSQPVLVIDQSKATNRYPHEMVMVAVRVGNRAVPCSWRCVPTEGNISWPKQREALEAARQALPEGVVPVLMGDRFYGRPELIEWCRTHGWSWCIRIKKSLIVNVANREIPLWRALKEGRREFVDVGLTRKPAKTNIIVLHDEGFDEPWIIAMDCPPNEFTARGYGKRWAIECMFSDFKSRGFDLTKSQIRRADRLERLILNMSLAMYWAVSTGMWDAIENPTPKEKKSLGTGRRAGLV